MPFPVMLIVPAVRAAIRLEKAGDAMIAQHLRDADEFIPSLDVTGLVFAAQDQDIIGYFLSAAGIAARAANPGLEHAWTAYDGNTGDAAARAALIAAAAAAREADVGEAGARLADELRLTEKIKQWRDETKPLSAWKRFALTFADVALEFVASAPNVMGLGGNGEKLIGALAQALSDSIPDDGDFGPKEHFGERVVTTMLRSGLQVASAKPDLIFGEQHLQKMITAIVPPVVNAFPKKLQQQCNWHDVTDALLGPMASAAFATLADNQKAFLGERFDSGEALGAVTESVLKTVAAKGIANLHSKEAIVEIYQGVLGVAVAHPELFLGRAANDRQTAIQTLFSQTVAKIGAAGANWDPALGLAIVKTGLKVLGPNVGKFVKVTGDDDWNAVLQGTMGIVIDGVRANLGSGQPLSTVLNSNRLVAMARAVFVQVAQSPRMVAGGAPTDLQSIVASVARMIAADDNLLLSGDEWLEIVGVVLREAAANPGRLFGFNPAVPESMIAERVVSALLAAASDEVRRGREAGGVLFGETLKVAMTTALGVVSGNLAAASAQLTSQNIENLATQISARVRHKPDGSAFDLGSKEWLAIFRTTLSDLLATGQVPNFVDGAAAPTDVGAALILKILTEEKEA